MVRTSLAAGFDRVIGFDMGGTSTDVSHFAGRDVSDCERAFETQVAGVRMRAPMMSIHTVAAGGGSILHFDGARLRVGPDSAGANPGPACYRRGGPLAVTDCNVMVGKIQPAFFPHVFGPRGDQALDAEVVRERFAELAAGIRAETGRDLSPEQVAEGYIDIAVGNMAEAIKRISVQRGHDVTKYTLSVFGGAGGQHACRVADALGDDADLRPPARRRAVRLRHGSRGPDGDARGIGRAPSRARRRWTRSARRSTGSAPTPSRTCRRRVLRRTGSAWCGARTCATKAPTPR